MDRNAVAGSLWLWEAGYDSGFDLWIICVVWISDLNTVLLPIYKE